MIYWLDTFICHCEARVKAGTLAQRTLDDYTAAIKGTEKKAGPLRVYFAAPITPSDIDPQMVQEYLDTMAELGRPVQANREKACLSSCMSWLIRTGKVPGLKINPCLRASGIKRNPESKRERYVTDSEFREVWAMAGKSVRLMMELTYRTLQRPESDIIGWTTANLVTEDKVRKLSFRQGKTGKSMKIALTPELIELIKTTAGNLARLHQPLVHTRDGKAYTYDGLCAMLKRNIATANRLRKEKGLESMPSFGFRDLKGKGATDMWRAGVPIETIQHLCGHEDKATTETYVKQRWQETAITNQVVMR